MNRYDEVSRLSVGEVLQNSARAVPGKEALVSGTVRMSYKELDERVTAFAASLQHLGFAKGDRLAIYMKNSAELAVAFYASQKIGVIVAWVNPNYREVELTFILQNSGAKAVVIFSESWGYDYPSMIQRLKPSFPELTHIIAVGGKGRPGVLDFEEMIDRGSSLPLDQPTIDIHTDLSMLIYTSGTTGVPKGAMITHYQVVRGGYAYSTGVDAGSDDVFIGFLPNTHSYGCGSILIQPFLLKAKVVFMEVFRPEDAFVLMEREGVTLQLASPTHYLLELDHPALRKYDLSRLRAGLVAGMVCPEGLITRVQEEMNIYLTSFWGASEVGPGLGMMCPPGSSLALRERSVGQPFAGTEVKIIDPEGRELPPGEVGEMLVRGWHVLKGYWRNPEETRKQIEPDGWLHTGDLVSKDEDGFLVIYGRIKDMIVRGGFKIYPFELEKEISRHPKVSQVCIVPTKNPILGESTCVCIIPRGDSAPTLAEIRDFLKDQVAVYKLPDELAIFSEFPRLSGGVKIKKFGAGGLIELAENTSDREKLRK
ncbi:MAG: class I adenylate-forming enzyme family protein [Thermodesulfobacteriota bacterium]|nr:class I adenylate-forming enzyme family protein [Thermodesulfobacteriota bacterium]